MMDKHVFKSEPEEAGIRIDIYLAAKMGISRSFAQQLVKTGEVVINDKSVKPNHKIGSQDIIAVQLEVQDVLTVEAEALPLDVVYEDKDIIVVNKARGMVVHPAAGNPNGTLVNALLYHCRGELSGINGIIRPGIVHRLDKDTSGVMVAAKTDEAHRGLAAQIKSHTACRTYWALVHGNISEERGTVEAPIGRHPKDRIKMAVTFKHGREAVTHFSVLKRYGEYTWIECKLETGRTHQIRVHMAYIGHPVVNDPLYGYKKDRFPISGQALHSHCLDLVHPVTGTVMHFEAPAPTDFKACLQQAAAQSNNE
ncbi:23S rRNA pseudouridine1911/1915/1917 synthase [Megasphaera paucivorans]|uniref:Pseudouridine synthase n=2 Tax=Megasphaera paucivorans TaxID=349095 RepID=A0A1G9XUE7_9FIRM|nr:23S rRNA pseudouridine1911/1915/1917 synthase [Megasphaera paucivorans]